MAGRMTGFLFLIYDLPLKVPKSKEQNPKQKTQISKLLKVSVIRNPNRVSALKSRFLLLESCFLLLVSCFLSLAS
jgi:hypothetical protein